MPSINNFGQISQVQVESGIKDRRIFSSNHTLGYYDNNIAIPCQYSTVKSLRGKIQLKVTTETFAQSYSLTLNSQNKVTH